MTRAPACSARCAVASREPSSITSTSRQAAAVRRPLTTSAIESSSLRAGMTIDTVEGSANASGRKTEVDDIAVLDDVVLAFQPDFAVLAAYRHRAARGQRIVADDFGADEPALNVAVDLPGGELGRRAARDRPGAAFVLADGEKRHVAEQVVAGPDDPIEA